MSDKENLSEAINVHQDTPNGRDHDISQVDQKVSYIIPAHNEALKIAECLSAIAHAAGQKPHDITVVVSGSTTDETASISRSHGAHVILCCDSTSRAIQMNHGARESKGDILCFVHADVLLPLSAHHDITQALSADHQCGYFSYRFDIDHKLLRINARTTRREGIFTGGGDQSFFIWRECFEKLGGFDEKVALMEDFELHDRIKKDGLHYCIIPNDAIVSARKYLDNSYLKVQLVNGLIFGLYKMGVSTHRLKSWYTTMLT
jgi:rSAM/selenodomain-associated transferase 2